MEALALGRPVLVADTTALRELANRGLARATPLGCTPVETAQAIVGQLQNPLIPSDVTLPTWESCYEQLLTLYHSVVS
jgi:glycosyltransferase involved in cell wall biosynthesis